MARKKDEVLDGNASIVVVLLTNKKRFDDIFAVSRGGGKTTKPYRATDFKTPEAAQQFVANRGVPDGYRGSVDVISRGQKVIRPRLATVKSAVARRTVMPGQLVFLGDIEAETHDESGKQAVANPVVPPVGRGGRKVKPADRRPVRGERGDGPPGS